MMEPLAKMAPPDAPAELPETALLPATSMLETSEAYIMPPLRCATLPEASAPSRTWFQYFTQAGCA